MNALSRVYRLMSKELGLTLTHVCIKWIFQRMRRGRRGGGFRRRRRRSQERRGTLRSSSAECVHKSSEDAVSRFLFSFLVSLCFVVSYRLQCTISLLITSIPAVSCLHCCILTLATNTLFRRFLNIKTTDTFCFLVSARGIIISIKNRVHSDQDRNRDDGHSVVIALSPVKLSQCLFRSHF